MLSEAYTKIIEKRIDKAISSLEEALDEKYRVAIVSDCDPDGLCSMKMLVGTMRKYGFNYTKEPSQNSYGIVGKLQPQNKQRLSDKERLHLMNLKPDLIFSLDLPLQGEYLNGLADIVQRRDSQLISVDHHQTKIPRYTFKKENFLNIVSNEFSFSTSALTYNLCESLGGQKYNYLWAAVGLCGDKVDHIGTNVTICTKILNNYAGYIRTIKEVIELVGHSRKSYLPQLSDAILNAPTPKSFILQQSLGAEEVMKVYEELAEIKMQCVIEILKATKDKDVVEKNLVLEKINSPDNIGTPIINEVSTIYPDMNFMLYQHLPSADESGGTLTKIYFRRSNADLLDNPDVSMGRIARSAARRIRGKIVGGDKKPVAYAVIPTDQFAVFNDRAQEEFEKIKDVRKKHLEKDKN